MGNASGYLIIDEDVCDDNAWKCMNMHENVWEWLILRGGWVILGWVALYDMPLDEWECMRLAENGWECLISMEGCGSFHADLHYTTCMRTNWECIRLSHNGWACTNAWGMHQAISSWMNMYVMIMHENAWTCMRMYENGSYSGGCTLYDMHDECIRMILIQGMGGSFKTDLHWTGRLRWRMLPSPPFTRMTTHRFFFI